MELVEPGIPEVRFDTMSGELVVRREGDVYTMDLPTYALEEIPVTDAMERAFGVRPAHAVLGLDLICVFDDERVVRSMAPDQALLTSLPGRIQNATAAGSDVDCVSRSFCPKLSIPEDPVCGSAHCQIADYWAGVLGKEDILAYQASERGGYLHCRRLGCGRMLIGGEASLIAISDVVAPL